MSQDDLNLYLVQQADKTVQLDIARGMVGAAISDSAKVGGYANSISDASIRSAADNIYYTEQAQILKLQNDAKGTAQLQEAAATADQNYLQGVADLNADPAYIANGQKEVSDIRAAEAARDQGLDPSTAYNFGLGAAQFEKKLEDNLPATLGTSLKTLGVLLLALVLLLVFVKVA